MQPPSAAASSASRTPSVPRPSPRVSKPQTSTPPSATAAASKPRASSGHPPSPSPTCQQSYCPAAALPYRPPPPRQHQRRSRAFTTPPSAWSTSTSTPRAASGPVKPTSLGLSHGAVPSQPATGLLTGSTFGLVYVVDQRRRIGRSSGPGVAASPRGYVSRAPAYAASNTDVWPISTPPRRLLDRRMSGRGGGDQVRGCAGSALGG